MAEGIEPDWGCIGEFDEESGLEPEWDEIEPNEWECHSCNNGPCYQ